MLLVLAQAEATGLLELIKAVGLAGALLALVLIWLTRSFIPSMQSENAKLRADGEQRDQKRLDQYLASLERLEERRDKERKDYLSSLERVEERHERVTDKLVAAFESERSENQKQHHEFDSRIDELERDEDEGRAGKVKRT